MRRVISHCFNPRRLYNDIRLRKLCSDDAVDLYLAGWPCQPFSSAGKNMGAADSRCVFKWIFRYIKRFRPRAMLFENVIGLAQKHRVTLRKIVKVLQRASRR